MSIQKMPDCVSRLSTYYRRDTKCASRNENAVMQYGNMHDSLLTKLLSFQGRPFLSHISHPTSLLLSLPLGSEAHENCGLSIAAGDEHPNPRIRHSPE